MLNKLRQMWNSSLIRELLGGFLLVALLSVAIELIVSTASINAARQNLETTYRQSVASYSRQIDSYLERTAAQAGALLLDDDLMRIANSDAEKYDLYSCVLFGEKVKLYGQSQFASNDIMVVLPKQKRVLSSRSGVEKLSAYGSLRNASGLETDQGVWRIRRSVRNANEFCFSITLGYMYASQTSPFAVVEVDAGELLGDMKGFLNSPALTDVFLRDYRGNILAGSGRVPSEKIGKAVRSYQEIAAGNPSVSSALFGQGDVMILSELGGTGNYVAATFDSVQMLQPVFRLSEWLICGMVLMALITFLFVLFSYRRVLKPFGTLVAAMKSVERGDFSTRLPEIGERELNLVFTRFNSMARRTERLIREEYQMRIRVQETQLRFLQLQIQPHFLYNSLFSLYNLIGSGELESASDMALYLGKYYRITTRLDRTEIPIAEEMENIRVYLRILEIRFQGMLQVETCLEPGLERKRIPALSLLTLVENSVTHGFGDFSQPGQIRISAARKGEKLALSVSDNGSGMTEAEKKKLFDALSGSRQVENCHGLENVYRRIQLRYGSAELLLDSRKPHGLCVTLLIPTDEPEEGEEKHV